MAYVVRDRVALSRMVLGRVVSVVVVLVLCGITRQWWIALVGIPMSAFGFRRAVERESTLLRADVHGVSAKGERVPWSDVDKIAIGPKRVQITLGQQAPPRPGTRGVVVRPDDLSTRDVWRITLSGDPAVHERRLRELTPPRVEVIRAS